MHVLKLADFLKATGPIVDVRSPGEFAHAHLPGAVSLPLFSNSERARVGTAYKQQSRQEAVALALECLAGKISQLLDRAEEISKGAALRIHCWRGGMRSYSVAALLSYIGMECKLLEGGYKAYRRDCLGRLEEVYDLRVLGGLTGCGKTEQLLHLRAEGKQVIDLEGLANHRGSIFGGIGQGPQPSSEAFENALAWELSQLDAGQPIWVEDESRMIGCCALPKTFYQQLRAAPVTLIEASKEERIQRLLSDYGSSDPVLLKPAVLSLEKRLGSERTRQALEAIDRNDKYRFVQLLLDYYDRSYQHSLKRRRTSRDAPEANSAAPRSQQAPDSCTSRPSPHARSCC